MNKIKQVQFIFLFLFALLILYLIKFMIFDKEEVQNNVYNPRRLEITGRIKDTNEEIIADTISVKDETSQAFLHKRVYPHENLYSHIVGDVSKAGQVIGVETKYRKEFKNNNVLIQLKDALLQKDSEGNNVYLTIDSELQRIASRGLNGRKGAVVAIEPDTGKIIAMVSNPNFDPNNIPKNTKDIQEGIFLNRVTQTTFEPGSTFKIITALAAMREMEEWEDITYVSKGEETFRSGKEEITIREYKKKSYGEVDISKALVVSSNIFFSFISKELGAKKIKETADLFGMNEQLSYDKFVTKKGSVLEKDQGFSQTIESSFGQGKVQVTPMHMAVLTATIANGGIRMYPYMVDKIESPFGYLIQKNIPKVMDEPVSFEHARALTDMMVGVVEEGTGKSAKISNISVAGKTGTAENPHGEDHGWFIGFAPAERPTVAVVVLVENGGEGGVVAAPIARELMQYAIKRK